MSPAPPRTRVDVPGCILEAPVPLFTASTSVETDLTVAAQTRTEGQSQGEDWKPSGRCRGPPRPADSPRRDVQCREGWLGGRSVWTAAVPPWSPAMTWPSPKVPVEEALPCRRAPPGGGWGGGGGQHYEPQEQSRGCLSCGTGARRSCGGHPRKPQEDHLVNRKGLIYDHAG